ncbi:MAG TPA: glycosyltransferase family 4 protein [Pyrinomonadaceae bacterium]|nr:glycosyltransferase family 4 protein [Pyrinomonadaceae bacterium]
MSDGVSSDEPRRILFVFAWLVVGGEETEVRLLAQNLDSRRYRLEVVACFRKPEMPEQTHEQLTALGVPVDRAAYDLSFEDTVDYLARKIPDYSIVVACQGVHDVYCAYEKLAEKRADCPPLIEHGGLVEEATINPKTFTTRYIGVCDSIRRAAARTMPERPHHAVEIPSMVDLAEFNPADRADVRRELNITEENLLVGWVGRLDRKKRVEDFIRAAAIVHRKFPNARFVLIGGCDAFMPEYADELEHLTRELELENAIQFLGDRADVPRLLAGLDVFVWLSKGEGMPHVISEAGAARLPVVATRDNGTEEQIEDGVSGFFVPHESPPDVADAIKSLLENAALRRRLGANLRRKVEREYSAKIVARQWETLFEKIFAEQGLN